jgi:hypothetical protein
MSHHLRIEDFIQATLEMDQGPMSPVLDEFLNAGHHLSVVLTKESNANIKASLDGLNDLISSELLHRLFWTELCQREDFNIYRRNAFRTDDLFISHPILGAEFEATDAEEATKLGGVFIFDNQKWLEGMQVLTAEMAAHELGAYEESMVAIAENSDFQFLGQALIALTFSIKDLPEKFGFQLSEGAEEWMISEALEYAEPDSFDVSARLNPCFQENLSWTELPISKKEKILEFLEIGLNNNKAKVRNDSLHFLGCMGLHESTPESILDKLRDLGLPLVNAVLKSRQDSKMIACSTCGAKIGYGLCLECDSTGYLPSSLLSEDEADEIYLAGLELARNGRKFEAIEIWLPLANQGDITTIDAVIVTLWLLGKKQDAKSWLRRLSSLDIDQFNSLIERLEIPQSVAKTFKVN